MPKKFAKLFDLPEYGQILFLREDSPKGDPAVRFQIDVSAVRPEKLSPHLSELGVCAFMVGFEETSDGEKKRDDYFDSINEAKAESTAQKFIDDLASLCESESGGKKNHDA